jgi:hypothetical protein
MFHIPIVLVVETAALPAFGLCHGCCTIARVQTDEVFTEIGATAVNEVRKNLGI